MLRKMKLTNYLVRFLHYLQFCNKQIEYFFVFHLLLKNDIINTIKI